MRWWAPPPYGFPAAFAARGNATQYCCHVPTGVFAMHAQRGVSVGGVVRRVGGLSAARCAYTYSIKASLDRRKNSEIQIAAVGDVRHSAACNERAMAGEAKGIAQWVTFGSIHKSVAEIAALRRSIPFTIVV